MLQNVKTNFSLTYSYMSFKTGSHTS